MNEQLQNTMNDAATVLIEKAMSGLDSATGFLQAEIPEYVYQLMLWYGVKSAVMVVLSLIVCAIVLMVSVKYIKAFISAEKVVGFWYVKSFYDDDEMRRTSDSEMVLIIGGVASISILACLYGVIIKNFMVALQIWIAPKVWLVEYASTLIK